MEFSKISVVYVRFEVIVALKINVFWGLKPCSLVEVYRRFGDILMKETARLFVF